eukprot:349735-Chlamydomonas_euryale.AAC.1
MSGYVHGHGSMELLWVNTMLCSCVGMPRVEMLCIGRMDGAMWLHADQLAVHYGENVIVRALCLIIHHYVWFVANGTSRMFHFLIKLPGFCIQHSSSSSLIVAVAILRCSWPHHNFNRSCSGVVCVSANPAPLPPHSATLLLRGAARLCGGGGDGRTAAIEGRPRWCAGKESPDPHVTR